MEFDLLLIEFEILKKIGLTFILVTSYFVGLSIIGSAITRFSKRRNFLEKRNVYIKKFLSFFLILILLFAIAFVWGIDIRGVLIFASSLSAVLGIALFASWSVLSNITSSIIIFFSFPYRIGDEIDVVDSQHVDGKIVDMTLFYIKIEDKKGNITFYPNNLAIQKPITKINSKPQ